MSLNRNSWILIAINTIHSIIELFLTTFMVSYFLKLDSNNIVPASLFNIYTYTVLGLASVLIGNLVKGSKKLALFRSSFILSALLLMLIIWLKQDITKYVWLLGAVWGLEKVMYYLPQNILTSQIARGELLIKFNGYRSAISGIARILIPVVLGWFISMDSFIRTAGFILMLALIEFVLSSFFQKLNSRPGKPFSMRAMLVLAVKRYKIKLSLYLDTLMGTIYETMDILVVLYIVYMFKTDLNLGIFTSVFAVCTVLANMALGRWCRYKNIPVLLGWCALISLCGAVFFVFDTSELSLIVFNLTFASATKLIQNITCINDYKVSQDRSVASLYRAEYLALREVFLNIGRIIGFGMVIWIALSNHSEMLKYLILGLNILILPLAYYSAVLNYLVRGGKSKC